MKPRFSQPEAVSEDSVQASDVPAPVVRWHVFAADRHEVATYAAEEAAKAHCQAWPALYYVAGS